MNVSTEWEKGPLALPRLSTAVFLKTTGLPSQIAEHSERRNVDFRVPTPPKLVGIFLISARSL